MPVVPAPAAISVRSRQRTKVSQSESGHMISRAYGGQYYEVTLSYNPMTRAQAAPLIAFLQSLEGRNSIFYVEICGFAGIPGATAANFGNFDDDTKLHMITGSGAGDVTPAKRMEGASMLYTDTVYMRASLANDVQEVSLGNRGLIRLELDLVERLSS